MSKSCLFHCQNPKRCHVRNVRTLDQAKKAPRHVSQTKTDESDDIGDAFENFTIINELEHEETGVFPEQFNDEQTTQSVGSPTKQGQRRRDYVDEPAILAEIDALLFSGHVSYVDIIWGHYTQHVQNT